jgi:hypothetical protein
MDRTLLVERDVLGGMQLLEALDKADIPIVGAFRYQLPESGDWRLFLVSPWVDSLGPKAAYERIQTVLDNSPSLSELGIDLRSISMVSPNDSTVKLLMSLFPTGPGTFLLSVPMYERYGVRVENAHIYRMDRDAAGAQAINHALPKALMDNLDRMIREKLQSMYGTNYDSVVEPRVEPAGALKVFLVLRRADTGAEARQWLDPVVDEMYSGKRVDPRVAHVVEELTARLGLRS